MLARSLIERATGLIIRPASSINQRSWAMPGGTPEGTIFLIYNIP